MNSMIQSDEMLEREVEYFHAGFFRAELHPEVARRYMEANRMCIPAVDAQTLHVIEKVLFYRLDVEAVEYALRFRNRENFLTKKIQILFYLVEVRSKYFQYFFNCRTDRLGAALDVFASLALTVCKLIKGKYLIRRYGLV